MRVSTPLPFCRPSGAPAVAKLALTIRICPCTFGSERRPDGINIELQFASAGDIGADQLRQAKIDAALDQHGCGASLAAGTLAWNVTSVPVPRIVEALQVKNSVRIDRRESGLPQPAEYCLCSSPPAAGSRDALPPALVLKRTTQSGMEFGLPSHISSLRRSV